MLTPRTCSSTCVRCAAQAQTEQLWHDSKALSKALAHGYDPFKADVWSFGCTLFSVCSGVLPWRCPSAESSTFQGFIANTQPHVMGDFVMAPDSTLWLLSQAEALAHHEPSFMSEGRSVAPGTPSHISGLSSQASLRSGAGGSSADSAARSASWRSHTSASASHILAWTWPRGFSPALIHLLRGCLAVRPSERFTMEQVKAHPWFENPRWVPPAQGPQHVALHGRSSSSSVEAPFRFPHHHSRKERPPAYAISVNTSGPFSSAGGNAPSPSIAGSSLYSSSAHSTPRNFVPNGVPTHPQYVNGASAPGRATGTIEMPGHTASLPSASDAASFTVEGIAAAAAASSASATQRLWVDSSLHPTAQGGGPLLEGGPGRTTPLLAPPK